ncbi:uncharacterized protein LOC122738566 [Dromiciops gliroides]|uniref:uncharacterized protein LOC122738566 n=1 Tax=Dromiciops gliroides TaxID=33562 RepID=UPI001CC4C71C|nr:uncharacterized protein LOC122738566 [Dromiciops gliroides]
MIEKDQNTTWREIKTQLSWTPSFNGSSERNYPIGEGLQGMSRRPFILDCLPLHTHELINFVVQCALPPAAPRSSGAGQDVARRVAAREATCFDCHGTGREDPADTDPPPSHPDRASRLALGPTALESGARGRAGGAGRRSVVRARPRRERACLGYCKQRALALALWLSLALPRPTPSGPPACSRADPSFSRAALAPRLQRTRAAPRRGQGGGDARERRGTGAQEAPSVWEAALAQKTVRLRGSRRSERSGTTRSDVHSSHRLFLCPLLPAPRFCISELDKGAGERQTDLAAEGRSAAAAAERAEAGRGDEFSPARRLPSRRRAEGLPAPAPQDGKKQTDMLHLEIHSQ